MIICFIVLFLYASVADASQVTVLVLDMQGEMSGERLPRDKS